MRLPFLLTLLIIASPAMSKTVAELQSAGQLRISSSILPRADIVPGQKIEMAIDIATDRWFAGGTRLRLPEVAGLIILQTNDFASNSTEQHQGQTWVIQRWTLDIYPQRSGDFTIPPVSAAVEISDANEGVIKGTLYSPAVQFQAAVPRALTDVQQWVASPTFTVTQSFDKRLDGLQPGDAIAREVVFEATDVMAMMLPSLDQPKGSGLVAYPLAPVLSNSSNRGTTTARRVDKISYIAESQGRYLLPAHNYHWWNTQTGELQQRTLPEVEIIVGPGAPNTNEPNASSKQAPKLIPLLVGAAMMLLIACVLWLCYQVAKGPRAARFINSLKDSWRSLRALTKPALPHALNPDGSAEE